MSSLHTETIANGAPLQIGNTVRIEALDVLRGIALVGILFVNFSFFAMPDGLAWYGKVGPAMGIGVCVGVYCLLLVAMQVWLGYFRIGPLEWILRCITEWKWIAIRKKK